MLIASACSQYGDTSSLAYFNLDSLISQQATLLTKKGARLEKSGLVNGEWETQILAEDSALWARELDVFSLVDINKPGTVNAYDVTSTANQTIYQLKAKERQQGVIMHRVTYHSTGGLKTFEAFFKEENALYESERNYTMQFADNGLLSSYQLMGRQKVAFGDWVNYEVAGKVVNQE